MLRHIRLLILDLDYLVFDCALLKVQAVRQGMISLADLVPQSVQLPGSAEAEAGFRDHGFRWVQNLEIGLDEQSLDHLQHAYSLNEHRLIESGIGRIYPGIQDFVSKSRQADLEIALGAEASRDYLTSVIDRHQLDSMFEVALCNEEFGMGEADEMLLEIMRQAEVNPSETLVLGTRPHTFRIARALDILTIGCGWGIHQQSGLAEADVQSLTIPDLFDAMDRADDLAVQKFD